MNAGSKIFVAGHRGLVGSAIVRNLKESGFNNIVVRTRAELDLLNQAAVAKFFSEQSIDYVFLAAAKVGGIHANNTYPAEFLYENLQIELNIIRSAADFGVKRLLFLGSSCIYPKLAPQPLKEDSLLTGPLEPTNEAYALAKIAGLKYCATLRRQYGIEFFSAMPTNLYGPWDNFHPENSHVIPGMMRRIHEAKKTKAPFVTIWGTGTPKREFLHVDDLARGLLFLMRADQPDDVTNIGTGEDCTIKDLSQLMAKVVGYEGDLVFDPSKPDGTPRKVLDVSRIKKLGWSHQISLEAGLKGTYEWALQEKRLT